jgi:hypothetical protein
MIDNYGRRLRATITSEDHGRWSWAMVMGDDCGSLPWLIGLKLINHAATKKVPFSFQKRLPSDFLTFDQILATIRLCLEDMSIRHDQRRMTWRRLKASRHSESSLVSFDYSEYLTVWYKLLQKMQQDHQIRRAYDTDKCVTWSRWSC